MALELPLDQQGFILCHPAARPNLELSAFISTVGQTAGGHLANEDVTPTTAVIADVIRANDPLDPQARKEALLAALAREETEITVLVEVATLLYQTLFDAQIESDADFSGISAESGDGADADGGGAEGEAGDGGEFSPLPGALCTFSLDAAGLVRTNTMLGDLYADGQLDRLDLQAVATPINNTIDAERRRAVMQAFTALFPLGIGPSLATIADGADTITPGRYFLPIPTGVPGVVTCIPDHLDNLVLYTCLRARAPAEVLGAEDVTPISTVVCEIANEAKQSGTMADRETTKLDLFGRLAPLRIFLSEDRNGNGVQDADERDKNGDGEFATVVELESDAPLTENNRELALLASMSTTIFDTLRIEIDDLASNPSFDIARRDFFTDGAFEVPFEPIAFGVESALNDPANQAVLGTDDVVTAASTGTLQGRVTDARGQPVSGVQVVVSQEGAEVMVPDNPAVTDVDGHFQIRSIPVGDATVRALLGEFEVLRVTTNVVAVVTVNLEIAPTPNLELRPSALVFSEVEVGATRILTVKLTNNGTADLTLSGLVIEGAGAAAFRFRRRPVLPVVVSVGSEVAVDIGYEPTEVNTALATLRVESDATNAPVLALPLIGTGVEQPVPQIELSRTQFVFGEVQLNAFQTQAMVISNSGTAPLTIREVNLEVDAGSGFVIEQGPTLPAILPPNGELALRVRFQPTQTGVSRGIVRIQSDADETPSRTVALHGTGVEAPVPEITASPSAIEFGEAQINLPGEELLRVTQAVMLRNIGTADLTLTAIRVDSSQGNEFQLFRPPTLPLTIIPGAGLTLDVQYRPTIVGSVTGAVRIRSDAVNLDDLTIALNGTGVDTRVPKLSVSQSTLDYGAVEIGSLHQLSFDITNTGTGDLDIERLALQVPEGLVFQLNRPPATPFTLVPGATQRLRVEFQPNTGGYATGALRIDNNDVERHQHLISLRGEGVLAPTPQMVASPAVGSFGEVQVGSTRTIVVTISNPGMATLEMTAFEGSALSGQDFELRRPPRLPVPVRPGAEVDLEVVYRPQRAGSVTGTLLIRGTAPDTPVLTVPLHGTATLEPSPRMQVHPQALDYGEVQALTSQTETVTIHNHGTADLVIRTLSITDQSSPDFEIDRAPQLPVTVIPGSTAPVRVRYSPSAPGVASGALSMVGNDPDQPTATVSLNGVGASESTPKINATPTTLAFGEVQENGSRRLTLAVRNAGTATLLLTDLPIDGAAFRLTDTYTFPIRIQPQGVVPFEVAYEPTAPGSDSGTLRVANNSPETPEVVVALSGHAVLEPKPRLEVGAVLVDFADVQIGSRRQLPIQIFNTGTASLKVTELRVDGGPGGSFTLADNPAPVTVVEGGSIQVQVNFAPLEEGSFTGTFYAEGDADNTDGISVPLIGTGLTEPVPQIGVAPASVEFPVVAIGASRLERVTIRNTGTDDLIVTALAIDGGENDEFRVNRAPTLPVTVLPEGSIEVLLAYAPVTAGSASGTLTIASNDPGTPAAILSLNGVGAPVPTPQIATHTATLSFEEVEVGHTRERAVSIANMGNATLTIREINVESEPEGVFTLADASTNEISVAPQSEVQIGVVFAPESVGLVTGALQLMSDAANAEVLTVPLDGMGTEAPMPTLTASPAIVDFGALAIGQTRTLTVNMLNEGTGDLTITDLELSAADGESFALGAIPALPVVVPPNTTVTAEIGFTPGAVGSATGVFRILSNDLNSPTVLQVSGEALPEPVARLTASPSPMQFGETPVGTTATQMLSIANEGSVDLNVTGLTVNGNPNNVFRLGGGRQAPFTVAPGAVETVDIVFAPVASGVVTGTVNIQSNAPAAIVSLSGTGTAPAIAVDPAAVDFGGVVLEQSGVVTVTLTNGGTADLNISSMTAAGNAFSVSGVPAGTTLNPGGSLPVEVTFAPQQLGAANGILQIVSSAPTSPTQVPLSGNGLPIPVGIEVTPPALAFGGVLLGESRDLELAISNSSDGVLIVSDIRVSQGADGGFALSEPFAAPVDVVPGGSFPVTLMFTPLEVSEVVGAVEIESNAAEGLVTVPLSGRGESLPTAQLVVAPAVIDFGNVTLNDTQTQELTLRNDGDGRLTVNAIAFTAGGDVGFAIVEGPSEAFEIVPGGEAMVVVSFTPGAEGLVNGNLQIASDAENAAVLDVPLRGTGTAQPIALIGVEPANEVNFNNVEVGNTRSVTMTITNHGDADLTLDRVSVPEGAEAGFAINGGPIGNVVLAPGDTLEVMVSFTPVAGGIATGLFQAASNANNEPVVERSLRGTGTAIPVPVVTVTPRQISFGQVNVGEQATAEVQIENTGDADLTVANVLTAEGAASGFGVTGGPDGPTVLTPGEALSVTAVFAPVAPGLVTGTVRVFSDASNGIEQMVSLQGTGAGVPELTVSPLSIDFGTISVGNSSTAEVRIENSGTATLNVDALVISGDTAGFTVGGNTAGPFTLEPGAAVAVIVSFTPLQEGATNATLGINSNANPTPTATVELRGEGGVAMIDVQPPSLSFEPQEIGQSQTLPMQVFNGGTGTLHLTSVSIDEPSFVLGAVPESVAPGTTETIEVTFMPNRAGDIPGTLTIDNNSENAPQVVVSLIGTGTVPTGAGLLVMPTGLTFGEIAINESGSLSVTVSSVGLAPVTLFGLDLGGAGGFVLGESPGLPRLLAPGETAILQVLFAPVVPGPFLDQLRIESDDATDPVTNITLNGTGVEAIATPGGQP